MWCREPGCNTRASNTRGIYARHGLCQEHRNKSLGKICAAPECDRGSVRRGYCYMHDERLRSTGTLESSRREFPPIEPGDTFDRLTVVSRAPDRVHRHGTNKRWNTKCVCGKATVVQDADLKSGNTRSCGCLNLERVSATAIGRRIDGPIRTDHGYLKIWVPDHPRSDDKGRVLEHIVAMEKLLGRYLVPGENVHHINGDRADNSTDGPLQIHEGRWRSGNLELWNTSQPAGQRVEDKVKWAKELLALYEPVTRRRRPACYQLRRSQCARSSVSR